MNVWFDDPKKEVVSEEIGDGVILNKDNDGKIIGFEKILVELSRRMVISPVPIEIYFSQS